MYTYTTTRAPRNALRHVTLVATASLTALLLLSGQAQADTGTATVTQGSSASRSVTRYPGAVSPSTTGERGETETRKTVVTTSGSQPTGAGPTAGAGPTTGPGPAPVAGAVAY